LHKQTDGFKVQRYQNESFISNRGATNACHTVNNSNISSDKTVYKLLYETNITEITKNETKLHYVQSRYTKLFSYIKHTLL